MRKTIFAIFLAAAWLDAHAQSPLPTCPNSPTEDITVWGNWANCFGKLQLGDTEYAGEFGDSWANGRGRIVYADGGKYVGEFKKAIPNGKGEMISAKGYTIAEGEWLTVHTLVEGEWLLETTVKVAGNTWRSVGASENSEFWVLTGSIKTDGAFRRAWLTITSAEPDREYSWLSARQLQKFDCVNERNQTLSATSFSGPFGSGDVLSSFGEGKWEYVEPGTVFSRVMEYVCRYKSTPKK